MLTRIVSILHFSGVNPYLKDGTYDIEFLNDQPSVYESEYIHHVRFEKPIAMKVNGHKNKGVLLKP